MKAIILAGGFGTRLAHISGELAKPLIKVAGKPLLEHQVDFLHHHGIRDIRLSLHHRAEKIIEFCDERWPGQIEYWVEPEPLGTGGALKFASRDLREPLLVLNGDTLSDLDLGQFLASPTNTIVCTYLADARDFGLVEVRSGKVISFQEKPIERQAGHVNAGCYLLDPALLAEVPHRSFLIERELFPRLSQEGRLHAYIHPGYWVDVGTEERLRRARREVPERLPPSP